MSLLAAAATRWPFAGGLALLAGCTTNLDGAMQSRLEELSSSFAPHEVAIAYQDLSTGDIAAVNGDVVMHAASTMKVPVMIELFRQADAGELDLDSQPVLRNSFSSIVDASSYSLDLQDDSDAELYSMVGGPVSLRELLWRMIARSSNLATNALVERVDARRVQRTIESLGTTRMQVLRGVEDGLAYRQGLNNTATARDLMILLAAIARHEAASPESCRAMLDILADQEFNDMIPAGLPPGTRVAHKTGWITAIHHDAAVVYEGADPSYVLVVLTRGFEDRADSSAAVASVAREVHGLRR